ncbi:MAG: acetate kinase [Clostridiales bacterium]|jgi:acetate kinase|nr:acetate kinase [Clostridiales bacterium]
MKILVINAGSSSVKYQLIDMAKKKVLAKGGCERIGLPKSLLKGVSGGKTVEINEDMPDHTSAIRLILDALVNKEYGVIKKMSEISAVGHRVVHSGEDFTSSVLIDENVIKICERNRDLAPLHAIPTAMGMRACKEVMPDTPMAAVFDTAFHSTMPRYAYMYAIPYDAYSDFKVRKYGFHGTSHMYVSQEAARLLKKDIKDLKIVTCHLGNGASVTAVDGGKSVDTSMGLTPLEGLIMGTRCGDIDPYVVEFLMKKSGMTVSETLDYLNKKSGVAGISGISSDFRDLIAAADGGNDRARLAIDMFAYRVKKYIGAYAAVMGGLDAIVFTAGIGEHTPIVREKVLDGLEFLGVKLDKEYNNNLPRGKAVNFALKGSKVKLLLIPTDEELVIARETLALLPQ